MAIWFAAHQLSSGAGGDALVEQMNANMAAAIG
jgi:hypothetical protein